MQENRSFDHYFGTMSGVRGLLRPERRANANGTPIFDQYGYQPGAGVDAGGYLQPFNLLNDPPTENGSDTNDIEHDWVTQHDSWNGGAMDSFVKAHLSDRRRHQRPGHHGLLHPLGAALLLRPGGRVHDLRRLPLLGARPDRPEPADGHLRVARPGRARRAAR